MFFFFWVTMQHHEKFVYMLVAVIVTVNVFQLYITVGLLF